MISRVKRVAVVSSIGVLLAAGAACAGVNKSIQIGDGSQAGGQSTVNGSITVGSDTVIDGGLETVNGSIRIGDNSRFRSASTVNGSIRVGSGAVTEHIDSVNGTIRVAGNAAVSGGLEVVNGKIDVGPGSSVDGDVSNVNGELRITGTQIGGNMTTVTGDVHLTDGSVLNGDLRIEKPHAGWGWRRRDKPRIVIGPNSQVLGGIIAEQEIELFISDSARVGAVEGEASIDQAVRFSGERP